MILKLIKLPLRLAVIPFFSTLLALQLQDAVLLDFRLSLPICL